MKSDYSSTKCHELNNLVNWLPPLSLQMVSKQWSTSGHTVVQDSNNDEEDVKPGEHYQQQVETIPHILRYEIVEIKWSNQYHQNNVESFPLSWLAANSHKVIFFWLSFAEFPSLGWDETALVGTSIVQDGSTYKMTFKLKSAAKKTLRYCQLQYQKQRGGESTLSLSTECM